MCFVSRRAGPAVGQKVLFRGGPELMSLENRPVAHSDELAVFLPHDVCMTTLFPTIFFLQKTTRMWHTPVASTVYFDRKRWRVPSSRHRAIHPRHSPSSMMRSSTKYSLKKLTPAWKLCNVTMQSPPKQFNQTKSTTTTICAGKCGFRKAQCDHSLHRYDLRVPLCHIKM